MEQDGRVLLAACAVGFASACSYTNHAPLAPALIAQFHFTQAMAGFLTTGLFLSHGLMQVPGGHLADRFGARRMAAWSLALVCAGNLGIALAGSYGQLLFWKIFAGVGTGTCFVSGARYLAARLAGPRLHLAQGYYGGSILLGSGFVIFALPQVLAAFGWRGAFVATAIIELIAMLMWLRAAQPVEAPAHAHTSLASIAGDKQLWLLGVMQMASFGLVIVTGSWIVMLLRESLGLEPRQAGVAGSMVLMLGIGSRPAGGALVARLGVRPVLVWSLLMTAAGCLLLFQADSLAAALAGIVLAGVGCGLPFAALFNRAAALYPGRAGAAMGLVNLFGIVMILAGAPLVGLVADRSGSFRSSFAALAAFALAACAASFRVRKK